MKKRLSVFYVFALLMLSFGILFSAPKRAAFADSDEIKSKSFILLETSSGEVIKSKNENEKLPIASMCKIMTLLLSFEEIDNGNLSLNDDIVINDTAAKMGGSQVFLESGATYKVSELIKSIVVASANDACVAMAERIAGSEEDFVVKMNEKAKELKMENTVFTNCTGLPKIGQHSSAKDVSIMFRELIKHKDYFTFSNIWMDEINHPNDRKTEISNTNKLIRFYAGCDSGKTGYTSEAGHCLCASAVRDNMRLICVVISSPDSKTRFKEVSNAFNYGFSKFALKKVVDGDQNMDFKVKIAGGKNEEIAVKPSRSSFIFSLKSEKIVYETVYSEDKNKKAPITAGDKVGTLKVYKDNVLIDEIDVLSVENVNKKSFFDRIKDITENWAIA